MTECTQRLLKFLSFDRRKIQGSFGGGEVLSDGGLMLVCEVYRQLGFNAALSGQTARSA
jgi:hypothetical protein